MLDQLQFAADGVSSLLTFQSLFYLLAGTIIGIIVGAIPGLSPITALAVFLPITFAMSPGDAIVIFIAVYVGANFGGAIPSILMGLPGTPAAVMTAVEGTQLHKQGRSAEALGIALFSSATGQFVGGILVVLMLVPISEIAVNFLFPEIFAIAVLGLFTAASLLGRNVLFGMASAIIGLMLNMIGIDPMSGQTRFTFESVELYEGLDHISVIIGFLIVGEILDQLLTKEAPLPPAMASETNSSSSPSRMKRLFGISGLRLFFSTWRSSSVAIFAGIVIGILPGIGGSVAGLVGYQQSKFFARKPEKYGKGSYEAIAAVETANNSEIAGCVVPTFAFGIPGSPLMVLLLAALTIHGITPGPGFLKSDPDSVNALLGALVLAPIGLLMIGLFAIRPSVYIAKLPKQPVQLCALIISIIGVYSIQWSMFDVYTVIGAGLLSYLMRRIGMPVVPATLGILLGGVVESNFRIGLTMTGGYADFFLRPGVVIVLGLASLTVVLPMLSSLRKRRLARQNVPT